MAFDFTLLITCNLTQVEFDLRDEAQNQLARHCVDLSHIASGDQLGLFNLRGYLDDYVFPGHEQAELDHLGICIAEQVLGLTIFRILAQGEHERNLFIQLPLANPSATAQANWFARALARVPWEIAKERRSPSPSLAESNLTIRVVQSAPPALPALPGLPLLADEELRILFVFAGAKGAQALSMRQERLALQHLFASEIYPRRRVRAYFLSDGVTRGRLAEKISRHQGFHIVHWSGHGALHTLELVGWQGKPDFITAADLLDMFKRGAGCLPQLFYLSVCQSGRHGQAHASRQMRTPTSQSYQHWDDFIQSVQGNRGGDHKIERRNIAAPDVSDLGQAPAYTRGALALLRAGVPALVAMRYAVSDDYACQLALAFYRNLLADNAPKSVAEALFLAQKRLRKQAFAMGDATAPLLFGLGQRAFVLVDAPASAHTLRPRAWHHIHELDINAHPRFVGRIGELARLGRCFIGSSSDEVQPLTVIQGVTGVGKTALVAEVLSLWQDQFELILQYQAKPNQLDFEMTLRDIHGKLMDENSAYSNHIKAKPADAIFRQADAQFHGAERERRLIRNLVRCLHCAAVLLVLDNFETNLKPHSGPENLANACQDPAWDACLQALAQGLIGSPSRIIITCRRPLAALQATSCFPVWLAALPVLEGSLFVRQNFGLRQMLLNSGSEGREMVLRMLQASRFHPQLLDRLTRLVTNPDLTQEFWQCLQALEQDQHYADLPDLFQKKPDLHGDAGLDDVREIHYLQTALTISLEHALALVGADARCLLWMIALANEPIETGLLQTIWRGLSIEQERLYKFRQMRLDIHTLKPEKQKVIQNLSPKMHSALDALPEPPVRPNLQPLLNELQRLGLIKMELLEGESARYGCHNAVRERIVTWMVSQSGDCAGFTRRQIKYAFAERLILAYSMLEVKDDVAAWVIGNRAVVYCQEAQEYAKLADLAAHIPQAGRGRYWVEFLRHNASRIHAG